LKPIDKFKVLYILFPEGVGVGPKGYRTPITSPIIKHLENISGDNPKMVAPRGIEPLLPE